MQTNKEKYFQDAREFFDLVIDDINDMKYHNGNPINHINDCMKDSSNAISADTLKDIACHTFVWLYSINTKRFDDIRSFVMRYVWDCLEISRKKAADYTGDSDNFFKNFSKNEEYGIASIEIGILCRMCDKISRMEAFISAENLKVKDESIFDTGLDLVNYCSILNAYLFSSKEDKSMESKAFIEKIIAEYEAHFQKGNKTLGTLPSDWADELENLIQQRIENEYNDYLSTKIHQAISKRLQEKNNTDEEGIMQMIFEELEKYEDSMKN